jgi:hypothetical protein
MSGVENQFRNLVGMEGGSLKGWFDDIMSGVENQFRNLVGMGDLSLSAFLRNFIAEVLGTNGRSVNDWILGLIDEVEKKFNNIILTIEIGIRKMLGLDASETLYDYLIRISDAMVRSALSAVQGAAKDWVIDQINKLPGGGLITGTTTPSSLWQNWFSNEPTTPTSETRMVGTLNATGMKAEPRDTFAQIHQGERVLNPQETNAYNSQIEHQKDIIKKLNDLNTAMYTMINLMNQELTIQSKTMNSIKGLGSDISRSGITSFGR